MTKQKTNLQHILESFYVHENHAFTEDDLKVGLKEISEGLDVYKDEEMGL